MFLSLYIFRNRLLTSYAFLLRLSYLEPMKKIVALLSAFNDWKRSIFVFAIWLEVYSEFKLLVPTCNMISLRFKSRIFDLTWSYFSTTERKHFNKVIVANVLCKQKTVFTIPSRIIKIVSFCLLSPWLSRLWVLEDVELPFILPFLLVDLLLILEGPFSWTVLISLWLSMLLLWLLSLFLLSSLRFALHFTVIFLKEEGGSLYLTLKESWLLLSVLSLRGSTSLL